MIRQAIKKSPMLRRLYYRSGFSRAAQQSDELDIIDRLTVNASKTFVEFGFHPTEFNCIRLAKQQGWCGLVIDGNEDQVGDGRALLPASIRVENRFLTLDNLDIVRHAFGDLGVLSIDVDGNDYWFLNALLKDVSPSVICVEYNSTLGLHPITVPYDPGFDRHEKHPRGWYHGASLTALAQLCSRSGYGLAAVANKGNNAFFTRTGTLDPKHAWRPSRARQDFSGVSHDAQWDAVRHLPFVSV